MMGNINGRLKCSIPTGRVFAVQADDTKREKSVCPVVSGRVYLMCRTKSTVPSPVTDVALQNFINVTRRHLAMCSTSLHAEIGDAALSAWYQCKGRSAGNHKDWRSDGKTRLNFSTSFNLY